MDKPKIIVADKNPIIRTGLIDIVNQDGRFTILDAVADGQQFIDLASRRPFDIGIVGWALPDMTGGDVLEAVQCLEVKPRVVIYTGENATDVLRKAVKSGAWGFMSKSDEPSVLLETISSVAHGRLCFPYVDLAKLTRDPFEELTSREKELLAALANGWTNLQIATRIGISRNTVKYHLKNLYDKLEVSNRAMAVALYVKATGQN